jgi:hypothetical protein
LLGSADGAELGSNDGICVGFADGSSDGVELETTEGPTLGFDEGPSVGLTLGDTDGLTLGVNVVGAKVGDLEGVWLGDFVEATQFVLNSKHSTVAVPVNPVIPSQTLIPPPLKLPHPILSLFSDEEDDPIDEPSKIAGP